MTKPFRIIYHKDCLDGMAAAWVAARWCRTIECDYIFHAAYYDDPIPDFDGEDVIIVDFSYPSEKLVPIAYKAKSIVIIDHHDKAINDWANIAPELEIEFQNAMIRCVLGKENSGAILAWDYFFPGEQPPDALLLCEDHDMWHFADPRTKAFVAGMFNDGCIADQDHLRFAMYMETKEGIQAAMSEGHAVLRVRQQMIANIIRRNLYFERTWKYKKIAVANVPYDLVSDFAETVQKLHPDVDFVVMYDDWAEEGVRKFSIRNDKNSEVNVGEIAEKLGGGGRAGTGGFTTSLRWDEVGLKNMINDIK